MLKIGTGELLVILAVALLIFGPSKLPALGKMAGKAIGTLRHYADTDNWEELMDESAPSGKEKQAQAKQEEPAAEEKPPEEPEAEREEQAS